MIIGLAAIHCLSAGTCYRVTAKRRHSPASATLFFVGFLFLTCTVYLGLFFNRTTLLGADLYRVTSDSMLPTLKPGDYILVDTRKYHNSPLTPGAMRTTRSWLREFRTSTQTHCQSGFLCSAITPSTALTAEPMAGSIKAGLQVLLPEFSDPLFSNRHQATRPASEPDFSCPVAIWLRRHPSIAHNDSPCPLQTAAAHRRPFPK